MGPHPSWILVRGIPTVLIASDACPSRGVLMFNPVQDRLSKIKFYFCKNSSSRSLKFQHPKPTSIRESATLHFVLLLVVVACCHRGGYETKNEPHDGQHCNNNDTQHVEESLPTNQQRQLLGTESAACRRAGESSVPTRKFEQRPDPRQGTSVFIIQQQQQQ